MEKDFFSYRHFCEMIITSDIIAPDEITKLLGVIPTRSHSKGEKKVSISGLTVSRNNNLWALKSDSIITTEESIDAHIQFFKSIFLPILEKVISLKNDDRFEVVFWIWIETDNAGLGMDITETDLLFISKVANRTHFSLITNRTIGNDLPSATTFWG